MKVKFTQTYKDYFAFNKYCLMNEPSIKKTRIASLVIWILFPIITLFFLFTFMGLPLSSIIFPPITMILLLMLAFSVYNISKFATLSRFVNLRLKKYLKNKDFSHSLGHKEIEISPSGIISKTKFTEGKMIWEGITKIVNTEKYIFLFFTDSSAYIIPVRIFPTQSEKYDFLRNARKYQTLEKNK